MKKYFNLFAAAILAIMMVACVEKTPKGLTLTVAVSNVTDETADVVVTASDSIHYYYLGCIVESTYSTFADATELGDALKEVLDYYIQGYAQTGQKATYTDFLACGNQSGAFKSLQPETKYVLVAYPWDEATSTFVGTPTTTEFTTLKSNEPTSTKATISLAISGDTLYFVPSDQSLYMFANIISAADVEQNKMSVDQYAQALLNYQLQSKAVADFCYTGAPAIYAPLASVGLQNGDYYAIAGYVNKKGAMISKVFSLAFSWPTVKKAPAYDLIPVQESVAFVETAPIEMPAVKAAMFHTATIR